MKKSLFTIMTALGICAMMTACGGSSDNSSDSASEQQEAGVVKIKPETSVIGGQWGKAFDIEDKEYTVKLDYGDYINELEVNINVTRNGNTTDVDFAQLAASEGQKNKYVAELTLEAFDENGESVFTADFASDDITKVLSLCQGDKATIKASYLFHDDENDAVKNARSFRLTSVMRPNEEYGNIGDAIEDLANDVDVEQAAATLDAATDIINAAGAAMGAAATAANAARKIK